jgi:hypothetical protein
VPCTDELKLMTHDRITIVAAQLTLGSRVLWACPARCASYSNSYSSSVDLALRVATIAGEHSGESSASAGSKPPPRRLATLQDQLCTSIGGNLDIRASSTLNSSVMTITILSVANEVGNEGFYHYATPLYGVTCGIAA